MSSDKNSLQLLIRQVVPYWISTVFLVTLFLFSFVLILRHQDRENARLLLVHFQTVYLQHGAVGLQLFYAEANAGSSFLRFEGGSRQLILVHNDGRSESVILPDFSAFPISANQVWSSLQPSSWIGPWTVAAVSFADHNILQVGVNSSERLSLLREIGIFFLFLLPLVLLLCFIPAWFNLRRNSKILHTLTRQIVNLTNGTILELQQENCIGSAELRLTEAIKHQMARYQRLSRELQESMDNVAHDLRTPMARLRSIAEYGLHKGEDNKHLREALADCLEESDRLLSMLNTMLNVAEAEADTVQLIRPEQGGQCFNIRRIEGKTGDSVR